VLLNTDIAMPRLLTSVLQSISYVNECCIDTHSENLLSDYAHTAAESGARSTAAKFYANSIALLQDDPWNDNSEVMDVYYDETLQLYTRAAECYLYMGEYQEALRLLLTASANAKNSGR